MSLFQCENCGCVENTACSWQGHSAMTDCFDWSGYYDLKGKKLCSVCGPDTFADGEPSGSGKWHNRFRRTFLPKGMFKTNREGNLEHVETGETDYTKYELNSNE